MFWSLQMPRCMQYHIVIDFAVMTPDYHMCDN